MGVAKEAIFYYIMASPPFYDPLGPDGADQQALYVKEIARWLVQSTLMPRASSTQYQQIERDRKKEMLSVLLPFFPFRSRKESS